MKYIVINSNGVEVTILFPDAVAHSQAVNQAQGKPIAAGFCYVQNGRWIAYGSSDSLGIGCRGHADAEAIQMTFDLSGVSVACWKDSHGTISFNCGAPGTVASNALDACPKCGAPLARFPGAHVVCALCTAHSPVH